METFELHDAALRAGVSADELRGFVERGVIAPGVAGRFTSGDVRQVSIVHSLVAAGISLEGLGEAIRNGQVSLAFLDAPAFERFSAFSGVTFAQRAEQGGAPVELLMLIREAAGYPLPGPDDRIRDDEQRYVEMIETALEAGFRPAGIQQLLRVHGDTMRRLAETESAVWTAEVVQPAVEAGKRPDQALGLELGDRLSVQMEQAVIAMYHLQQTQAWSAQLINGLEWTLAEAGLHSLLEHPPAMCFLDITGYTRLTQERGDAAAAELAERVGKLVQRTSVAHGGRPVKWLGDGVMIHFPNPGRGVDAALQMVAEISGAGLPPAHVGLHAGPVIFQDGDYYGQTVNVASRIAGHAQAGEVIVSQAVVDASEGTGLAFRALGPIELKGVAGAMHLYEAAREGEPA
jgi:adenylate cyclase